MSLGGPVNSALNNAAVISASAVVKFALAAGNESDDAINHSPAKCNGPGIYHLSYGQNGYICLFSNYGLRLILGAPGVCH
jgi:hypothetical protein